MFGLSFLSPLFLAGALAGSALFGVLYPRLQRPLGLPPLATPPSERVNG